ncbi:MAG: ASKHA domain-containing protein [Spirochaetaceae bacterium]|nr:ASKHA domain-containing protein [Spirochaetaceae bacterium]
MDIGTTTLALRLVDLRTGTSAGKWTAVNRQREWGADVLSRIQKANEGGLGLLSQSIRAQIAEGIRALCAGAGCAPAAGGRAPAAGGRTPAAVGRITVAANTTMVHLLLGLSCETLGVVPFTPLTLGPVTVPCRALFDVDCAAEVTVLPGVSTYVGADIVAGIFFSGMYQNNEPSLLLDIGTNGEMALCADGAITVAATAAGPAFEGGNIRWGTGSVPGAISRMRYENGVWAATTIEDRPPVGICGTGLISAVWQGLRHGFIASGGNYDPDRVPDKALVLARNRDGDNITLEQKDIRELQLAKSAVCSGLGTLLNHAGIDAAAVGALYVAGGFGHNIDYESAAGIGLIPRALRSKVRLIGNSALGGAVRCLLDPRSPEELARIIALSAEYKLSGDRSFNEAFIENVIF